MRLEKSQYIELSREARKELYSMFPDVTSACIGQALSFTRNSDLCKRIREAAFQLGGELIELNKKKIETPKKVVKLLDNRGKVKAIRNI